MKRVQVPGTDFWVAPFAFSTAGITPQNGPRQLVLLEQYLAAGGNLIDTAYCEGREPAGDPHAAEQFLGRFLGQHRGDDHLYIISSAGNRHSANALPNASVQAAPAAPAANPCRLSEHQLRCELLQSRKALHRARIDLYMVQHDQPELPIETLVDLLELFIAEGLIARYGLAGFSAARVAAALDYCRRRHSKGLVAVSKCWSLSRRNQGAPGQNTATGMDDALYELLLHHSLTAMPYGDAGSGYFSCLADNPGALTDSMKLSYGNALNERRFAALQTLSRERGVPIGALALAFMLQQPFSVIPVLAFSAPGQLQEAIQATEVSLRPGEMEQIGAGERY